MSYLCLANGDVVTIRHGCAYITAWDDRRTVSLEGDEVEGSEDGEYWTVQVICRPDGSISRKYYLRSIYGTYLDIDIRYDRAGFVRSNKVCQGTGPSVQSWMITKGPYSRAPPNLFGLRTSHDWHHGYPIKSFLCPQVDGRIILIQDLHDNEFWHIELVRRPVHARPIFVFPTPSHFPTPNPYPRPPVLTNPTPFSTPTPYPQPPVEVIPRLPAQTPTPPQTSSHTPAPSHTGSNAPTPSVSDPAVTPTSTCPNPPDKYTKKKVVNNIVVNNPGGGGEGGSGSDSSPHINTGQNINFSGKQKNGGITM